MNSLSDKDLSPGLASPVHAWHAGCGSPRNTNNRSRGGSVSAFSNPFNPGVRLGAGCDCGRHASQAEHDLAIADEPPSGVIETLTRRAIQTAGIPWRFAPDARPPCLSHS